MSDELECFRRAAELGCPDLLKSEHSSMWLRQAEWLSGYMMDEGQKYLLPDMQSKRINRQAAAVCAEWWATVGTYRVHPWTTKAMIEQARAFGRKYGAS